MSKALEQVPVSTKAINAALGECNRIFAHMKAAARNVEHEMIGIMNDAIQLGFYFQEATGKEQLEFYLFESIQSKLDKDMGYHFAHTCVNLVNRYGRAHRFKSFAEVQPEMQPLFRGLNMLAAPQRAEQTAATRDNPDIWMVTALSELRMQFEKRFAKEPMPAWPPERLDTFIHQTKKLHDDHEEAVKLRSSV